MSEYTKFRLLFDGLDRVHGKYEIDHDLSSRQEKVTGKAVTIKAPVTMELFAKHLEGEQGLGIVPIRDDQCCVFGALDIDEYPLDLEKLSADIERLKLPLVVCRTKSGGAHCYLFCKEPIRADIVRDKLKKFAEALGYPSIEIFPKQKELRLTDVGNWINLPYFDSAHGKFDRYAIGADSKPIMKLADFIAYADSKRVGLDVLKNLKPSKAKVPFGDGPPCLQRLATNGFPEGTRNNCLFNLGVYCRKKFHDAWEDELEGMNHEHMDPPLKSSEVQQVLKSVGRKEYQYTCDQAPLNSVCSKDACLGRKYGVGGGDGEADLEMMMGGLRRSISYDLAGEPIQDDEVMWIMDIDGVELQLTTLELTTQAKFRTKVAERVGKWPLQIRGPRWDILLKDKIENAELIEFPAETGTYGQIVNALKDFTIKFGGAEIRDEILSGKVWEDDDGELHFQNSFFWKFLVQRGIYRPKDDGKKLHKIMEKLGARKKNLRIDATTVRKVWAVKNLNAPDDVAMPKVTEPKLPY